MIEKPTYEELEQRVIEFEKEAEKRKRTEETLEVEREQLFSIFDRIVAGIYVSDINTHKILYVNQASKDAFQKELIGKVCYKELQGLDSPCEFCTNEIIQKQKPAPHRWEYHNPVLDRDYELVDRIIKWPDGREVRLEVALDITDHKRAEKKLEENERFLSAVLDSIQDGISVLDLELNIIRVNQTMNKLYVHMLPLEGKKCYEAYHGRTEACEICPTLRAMESGGLEMNEVSLKQTEGVTGTLELFAFPMLNASGKPTRVVEYVRDITERKRTQEMMIQSEKMLSVGGLAAGMAHEINNPLAGIMQNVQVMKNRMSEKLPNNIKAAEECGTSIETIETYMEKREMFRMIESVIESGKRAAKIVDNMLSFSRKSNESFAPHSLCDLLDKTVELAENDYDLKKKFDFREIEILREYDGSVSNLTCEPSKIQQVFLNILKNGAQAMTENKNEEDTPRFILRVMQEGEMARVEIADNGPGMDETTCKRIFDPFYTTKPVGKGTGLGMSVSYFIITENHGGTMEVESAPGKGAKFIIRLPFERNIH